jgi:hypothetical protein
MGVPVVLARESFIDAVVEVLVVRKDDMAADIVELYLSSVSLSRRLDGSHTKPSFVTSVEARPPGVSFESTIIQEGPFWSAVSDWSFADP